MIRIYCRERHHSAGPLCEGCAKLRDYAHQHVERCRFGADKPVCAKCTVHCYNPAMRESVREVMRYSGPRMLAKHPVLALMHLFDSARSRT